MRRRETLSALGLLALAGCLAPGGGETGDGTTETTEEETTTTESGEETTTSTETTTTTPEPTDWTADFTPVSIECASEDASTASVAFEGDEVTVDGTIIGSDMCYRPKLSTVAYDEETSELVIIVESVREADEDTACAECIAAMEYQVVGTFDGDLPSIVAVRHERDGSQETVTKASR